MKRRQYLAALALIACAAIPASCSSDDEVTEQKNVLEAGKTYNLSIGASKGGNETRALSLDVTTSTLNATWAITEQVFFCNRGDISFSGSISPTTGGSTITYLNGTITPSHTLELPIGLYLIFPRKEWSYTGQVGTIEDIEAKYDYITTPISLSKCDESGIEASTSVNFATQQAVVKFTLKDGETLINAKSLRVSASGLAQSVSVSHSGDIYTPDNTLGDITITPATPSKIFAALRGISGKQVRLTAVDNNNQTYVYTKNNVTFTHGQYYEISVKMKAITEGIALANVTSDYIGCVVGQNGKVYSTSAKATTAGTTAVAMIAYVGSASNCSHGLAVALADESGTMNQDAAITAASTTKTANTPVTNGTWRLPTVQDWEYMLIGCGNGASYSANPGTVDASALTSKLATLGAPLQTTANYWSSISYYAPYFVGSTVQLDYSDPFEGSSPNHVRAVLAF